MTEKSYLWTTGGAGDGANTYTRADWSKILKIAGACRNIEGVARNYLNELVGSVPAANTARIGTGAAIVDGKPYDNSAAVNVNIPSAVGAGNTRIDRIVLRCGWSAQTVRITRIAGTDAVSPAAPAITQTSETTYDIMLYQALVDASGVVTLTDERVFADIGADEITNAMVADNAINTDQLVDASVTSGKLAQPKPYSCKAYAIAPNETAVSTGLSGGANIAFPTEEFDSAAMHSNSTNNSRVICKRAGRYFVFGEATIEGNTAGTVRQLAILKNGTTQLVSNAIPPLGTTLTDLFMSLACYVDLALNDYVELHVYHNAGVTLDAKGSLSLVWDG